MDDIDGMEWFLDEEPLYLQNIWVDMFGNRHYIQDMSTKHIKNCIKLIYKKQNWRVEYLKLFKDELLKRKWSFSYFHKPIEECSDSELINWLISFLNGANYNERDQELYHIFCKECENRSKEFNNIVKEIQSHV